MAILQTAPYEPRDRRIAVAAAGALLLAARALNASRPPDHREALALAVAATQDSFRLRDHELPAARTDLLLDAVHELQSASESSTQGYEAACAELDRLWRLERRPRATSDGLRPSAARAAPGPSDLVDVDD